MVSKSFKNVDKQLIDKILYDYNQTNNIVKFDGGKATIYKNNTILIQGANIEWFLAKYFNFKQPEIQIQTSNIGCDETGVGDYFGPLVSACAYVNEDILNKHKDIFKQVTDSKKINDSTIIKLANELKNIILFRTQVMQNEVYNQLYDQYKNTHILKAMIHNRCLDKFLQNNKQLLNTQIVLDEFVNEKKYYEYLKNESNIIKNIIFMPKAELKVISVACASILARAELLNQINILQEQFKITLPLGAGLNVKQLVKEYKKYFNYEAQRKFIKLHFKI